LKGSFRQFNKCIATRRPPQGGPAAGLRMASELLRLAQYGDNHEGGAGPDPHSCDRNCHRTRRDSIAGAVLASAELCRRSTADRLYERARAAMPGQGSIERLKLRSTRTPRPFATNIGYSVQLPLARRFGAGDGSCQHTGCRRPHSRHSYWPGFYLAGCLVPGSTLTRALRYTKWPVESQAPRYST
jgi:hypothetical protein